MDFYKCPWFHVKSPRPSAAMRLFCFPYAGGSASIYHDWSDSLPHDVEVIALQYPGRGNRFSEELVTTCEGMVAALLPHIGPLVNKPFAFFGHSNGGLVSFEVARALQRAGNEWQAHHFISGKGAIHLPRNRRELHNLPDEEFIKELESLGGTPDELLMCRDLMSIFMPILRADFSLNEAFNYKSDIRLKSDVSLLCGQYDKGFSEDSVAKWSDLIDGEMDITVYDGDHFFINSKRQDVLNFINGKLVSILAEINKEARYA